VGEDGKKKAAVRGGGGAADKRGGDGGGGHGWIELGGVGGRRHWLREEEGKGRGEAARDRRERWAEMG
jgi:hypothetical protein